MTEPATTYEVSLSRYFDAPPELVYQAFVDPNELSQWFGPLMFHVPVDTISIDAKVGGHWKLTMVGNSNPEWSSPIDSTFTEVIEDKLLVGYELAHGFSGMADGTKMILSLEFIPEGDGTRLELRQGPFSEEMREMSSVGWSQSFYKLDGWLATPAKFRSAPE